MLCLIQEVSKTKGTKKTWRDIVCLPRDTPGHWGAGRGRTAVVWGDSRILSLGASLMQANTLGETPKWPGDEAYMLVPILAPVTENL